MDRLRYMIRISNKAFSSILLILFYIVIIPLGTVIYTLVILFKKKDNNTYWHSPEVQAVDLHSPY